MFNSVFLQSQFSKFKNKNKIKTKIIADENKKGSDILYPMCLGTMLVGRPAIFGLIVNGHKAVENILKI